MSVLACLCSSLDFSLKDYWSDVQVSEIMKPIAVINATVTCMASFHLTDKEVILYSPWSETVVLCKNKQAIYLFIF